MPIQGRAINKMTEIYHLQEYRIKKEINESRTLKDSMIRRKSNINSKLMEKWFKK